MHTGMGGSAFYADRRSDRRDTADQPRSDGDSGLHRSSNSRTLGRTTYRFRPSRASSFCFIGRPQR